MGRRRRFTDVIEKEIKRGYEKEKVSTCTLAKEYGCNHVIIGDIIIRQGGKLRTHSEAVVNKLFSNEVEKKIERQYQEEKVSINILAKEYSCDQTVIRSVIIRQGGKLRTYKDAQNTESCKQLQKQNNPFWKGELVGEKNPFYSKHHSEETKQKIREKRIFKMQNNPGPFKNTKPELKMKDILNDLNIPFKHQFRIKNYLFDFHILNTNILIEVDGDYWHGNPKKFKKLSKKQKDKKQRDLEKEKLAKNNNFVLLRFWQSDILKNTKIVKEKICEVYK